MFTGSFMPTAYQNLWTASTFTRTVRTTSTRTNKGALNCPTKHTKHMIHISVAFARKCLLPLRSYILMQELLVHCRPVRFRLCSNVSRMSTPKDGLEQPPGRLFMPFTITP